jgi:uncharacterized protein YkwD
VLVTALLVPAGALAGSKRADAERLLVDEVNEARRGHGQRPFRRSTPLARTAAARASGLMELDVFEHGDGIGVGGGFSLVGEALAMHSGWKPRAEWTVRRWLRSPSHQAIVLGHRFRHVGAGLARGLFHGRLATVSVLHVGSR